MDPVRLVELYHLWVVILILCAYVWAVLGALAALIYLALTDTESRSLGKIHGILFLGMIMGPTILFLLILWGAYYLGVKQAFRDATIASELE